MIDLFGRKARAKAQEHLKNYYKLEDALKQKDRIIKLQAQKIEHLKNEVTWFGDDIDYPNSHN